MNSILLFPIIKRLLANMHLCFIHQESFQQFYGF